MEAGISEKLVNIFRVLGIGRREAKVYFIVLTKGPITARDIALQLNTSPTKVYEPLNKLVSLGLIAKTNDRPAKFIAVEPRIAWHRLKSLIETSIKSFEERVLPQIEAMYKGSSSLYRILIVPSNDIISRLSDVVLTSDKSIDLALAYRELLSTEIIDILLEAVNKVKVRLLIDKSLVNNNIIALSKKGVSIRITDGMFGSGVIGNSVLLVVRTKDGGLIGMWSDHEFFVEVAKVYFEHLWSKSRELTFD